MIVKPALKYISCSPFFIMQSGNCTMYPISLSLLTDQVGVKVTAADFYPRHLAPDRNTPDTAGLVFRYD